MKAIVKVAYFDNSGLHKAGEVVDVKALKPYHLPLKEVEQTPTQVEEEAETETPKKTTKKATKKTTKKKV